MKDTSSSPLPKSGGQALDKSGVSNGDFIDKKGTPSGESAMFNKLPPGEDIDMQEVTDIRPLSLKIWEGGLGYPGDGWT